MDERIKEALRYIILALAGAVLISWYFAGLLQTTFTGYGASFNPVDMIICARMYGFPKAMFWLIMFLVGGTVGICAYRYFVEAREMDLLGRRFRQPRNRQGYGDAHFEEPHEYKDIARITTADKAIGMILGQLSEDGKHVISTRMDNNRMNNHMAVVGASGSGKSYTFSMPYAYQVVKRRESIVITDPDGGLYRQLAGFFVTQGYVVKSLNLKNPEQSNGWNCLRSLQSGSVNIKADIFAETIIKNAQDGADDGIYTKGPMELLKALLLRVVLGNDFPSEKKNIKEVYNLLCQENASTFLDGLFTADGVQKEEMAYLRPWRIFLSGSQNLKGNIITNLGTDLQTLQSDEISELLSTDDIDLELPGDRPCAYFCQFPDHHKAFRFVQSLFFSMLFFSLIEKADHMPDGKLKVPVNFLLDEFPSIGALPDWDDKMSTVRKRNLNVAMIFQNITQLLNKYDDTWITLLGNCSTWVCLGINDHETANLIQKRIGETTIAVQTEQHQANEPFIVLGQRRKSVGEGKRALLSLDELFKIDKDKCLVLFQGHNPIYANKFPHVLHPSYKQLCPNPLGPMPPLWDKEGRAARQKKELEILVAYEEEHKDDRIVTEAELDAEEAEKSLSAVLKRMVKALLVKFQSLREDPNSEESETEEPETEELVLEVPAASNVPEDWFDPEDADEWEVIPAKKAKEAEKAVYEAPLRPKSEPAPETPAAQEAPPHPVPVLIERPIRFAVEGDQKERPDLGQAQKEKEQSITKPTAFVQVRSHAATADELDIISGKREKVATPAGGTLPSSKLPRLSG